MPVYDYACGACGKVVEVVHGIHAEGPRFCPSCGVEARMRKAFAAPAVVFKGSGWAKKDRKATATPGRTGGGSKDSASGERAGVSATERSGSGTSKGAGAGGDAPAGGGD